MDNHNIRVLLVDDEEQFVLNMARLLRFRGFQVPTALDGFQALDAVKGKERFDVVVLDVKMPGMNGLTTLAEIKKRVPHTHVIMLTAYATLESGMEAIRVGALDYLMKPFDIEDLTEKIMEACEVKHIKRRPVLWPRNLVKEITLPLFIRLETQDPLVKALKVFIRDAGMPVKEKLYVLDAGDRFQGIVTRRDLLDAAQKKHPERSIVWSDLIQNPQWLPPKTVSEVMQPDHPITTNPEEHLTQVARRMIQNNVRCMPVVEGETVKGFIRLQDIFQYVEMKIKDRYSFS